MPLFGRGIFYVVKGGDIKMPTTIEGQVWVARKEREFDRKILEEFGQEQLNLLIKGEGLYAYGFSDYELKRRATILGHDLIREIALSEIRPENISNNLGVFKYFYTHRRTIPELAEILVIEKPFPNEEYKKRLIEGEIEHKVIPVYRLADLTDGEIRTKRGGVLWNTHSYVDILGCIQR